MSTTYSIVCDDCKIRLVAGYTSQGGIIHGVSAVELLEKIRDEHIGCHIRLLCDLADDEASEDYKVEALESRNNA
jgi:hypothetical protein